MQFNATVTIKRRPSILDPQGKAVEQGAMNLGIQGISGVRFDKHIRFCLEAESREQAVQKAEELAKKLLVNLIMEDYLVEVS